MITSNAVIRLKKYGLDDLKKAHRKGIRLRFLTPITKENASDVKYLSAFIDFRHIDTIYMSMMCFDGFYAILGGVADDKIQIQTEDDLIFTNQSNTVLFVCKLLNETWEKATPATERLEQLGAANRNMRTRRDAHQ